MPDEAGGPEGRTFESCRARHIAVAAAVFLAAAALAYGEVWTAGPGTHVPVRATWMLKGATRADVVYEVWLLSRHAHTWVTAPHRLFDTEHCAPEEKSLALGIPMLALGLVAVPAWLATGDPVLTWNATLVLLSLLGAAAMYVLVVSWTGVPGAGIAAGLFFAFHPIRLHDVTHPSVWDTTWLVAGLFFAERLSARGRWRDAVGLAAAVALQIAASFYALLAAVCVGLPFAAWLGWRDRLRAVRPAQLVFLAVAAALAVAWLLGPYLSVQTEAGGGLQRVQFRYAAPAQLLPGGLLFVGWSALALAVAALFARRDEAWPRISGDPRGALLVGAALAAWLAMGDRSFLPDLHGALAGVVPGLDAVRVVQRVISGAHLALALLAGLGAAWLVRRSGRHATAVAALLVLVCAFDLLRAPALGLERRQRWSFEEVVPDPADRAFFAELARVDESHGALLEPPFDMRMGAKWSHPPRILSALQHGRRTSACYGSYTPPGLGRLAALTARLPAPDATRALADLGFTTLVFRWGGEGEEPSPVLERLLRAAERGRGLPHLLTAHGRSAFALRNDRAVDEDVDHVAPAP